MPIFHNFSAHAVLQPVAKPRPLLIRGQSKLKSRLNSVRFEAATVTVTRCAQALRQDTFTPAHWPGFVCLDGRLRPRRPTFWKSVT